jgi:1-acyl-sn-glycerol-3-phosphate acyltransferase
VVIYPEGNFTDDPDGRPMRGRTGVARMALATGLPVVPVATWGGHHVLPQGKIAPRLLPRTTVHMVAGTPVDLTPFAGLEPTPAVLRAATAHIMAAITQLLAEIRG